MIPEILFEDNHLLVVNKPFCMPTQGDDSKDINLLDELKSYIKQKYNKPGEVYLGLIHRLDRPVGGVMVFARTSKAAARLSKSFQQRTVQKTYYAITEKSPKEKGAILRNYVKQLPDKNIMRAYPEPGNGRKEAELSYEVVGVQAGKAMLKILPITGRKHQIRLQLATMGCSIVGDLKYGAKHALPGRSIALFAKEIRFPHPVKEKGVCTFSAELPTHKPWSYFAST